MKRANWVTKLLAFYYYFNMFKFYLSHTHKQREKERENLINWPKLKPPCPNLFSIEKSLVTVEMLLKLKLWNSWPACLLLLSSFTLSRTVEGIASSSSSCKRHFCRFLELSPSKHTCKTWLENLLMLYHQ